MALPDALYPPNLVTVGPAADSPTAKSAHTARWPFRAVSFSAWGHYFFPHTSMSQPVHAQPRAVQPIEREKAAEQLSIVGTDVATHDSPLPARPENLARIEELDRLFTGFLQHAADRG